MSCPTLPYQHNASHPTRPHRILHVDIWHQVMPCPVTTLHAMQTDIIMPHAHLFNAITVTLITRYLISTSLCYVACSMIQHSKHTTIMLNTHTNTYIYTHTNTYIHTHTHTHPPTHTQTRTSTISSSSACSESAVSKISEPSALNKRQFSHTCLTSLKHSSTVSYLLICSFMASRSIGFFISS